MANDKDLNEYKDEVRGHSFDGIEEYDNQLPQWWVIMFVVSIVFAFGYLYIYHFSGIGSGLVESYEQEIREAKALSDVEPSLSPLTEEELKALLDNSEVLAMGKAEYASKCVSCHGASGEGLVGPNLTDDYWVHGKNMTDMVVVVTEGVPAKGMVPWGGLMNREQIHSVVAYVKSLHGTNPPNAKKPEGQFLPEE